MNNDNDMVLEATIINMCSGSRRDCKNKKSVSTSGVILDLCSLDTPDCPKTGNHSFDKAQLRVFK